VKKWVSIYNGPYEKISLFSGLALLVVSLVDIAFHKRWIRTEGDILFFLGILFFNGLHVMSTFVNCAIIPEYRTVFKNRFKPAHFLPIVFLIGIIFFINNHHLTENSTFYFLFAHFIILAPLWHALRQTQGLSLLYNQNYLLRSTPEARERHVENQTLSTRLEKSAVFIFILAFYSAGLRHLSLPFRFNLDDESLFYVSVTFAAIGVFILLASIALLKRAEIIGPKLIFHTRTFARLLFPFTGLTAFVGQAVHGSEYLLMQLHIERNLARKVVVAIWAISIPLFTLKFGCDSPQMTLAQLGFKHRAFWIPKLATLGVTFTYVHYYMDSVIFKMSDPLCKQEIGALLLKRR
jgi:hypothetical protein